LPFLGFHPYSAVLGAVLGDGFIIAILLALIMAGAVVLYFAVRNP
jgi:hypothetical protein